MSKRIDLNGQKFGRWTVLHFDRWRKRSAYWVCRCDCGTESSVQEYALVRGRSKSCGCHSRDFMKIKNIAETHGLKKENERLYRIWQNMLNRCRNPNVERYPRYGGRGITVCPEWKTFPQFHEWAIANGYNDNLTIDRIDVNGNYEPSNCQWLTGSENSKKMVEDRRRKQNAV